MAWLLPKLPEAPQVDRADAKGDRQRELATGLDVLGVQIRVQADDRVEPLFKRMGKSVAAANSRALENVIGVKPADTGLGAKLLEARARNVDLINGATLDYFAQVKAILLNPDNFGARPEEISKLLQERGGVLESRAELIARDQTTKLTGEINQIRQENAGIDDYEWSTSGDERVRDEHAVLDGQVFSWAEGSPEGHPGEPIQCRCVAIPRISDLEGI